MTNIRLPAGETRAIVLFGIGSVIIGDVEESLWRAGITIAAGVRNRDTPAYLSDAALLLASSDLTRAQAALPYMVPLFTPLHRRIATQEAREANFSEAFTLVDSTCIVPRSLRLGEGAYFNAGCVVGASVRFGRFAFVNRAASIGHHLFAGDFVSIGPSAVIAGDVKLEDGALIGAGAVILPGRTIGAHAIVGAGSVVTSDVPAKCLVMGNPARIKRRDLPAFDDQPS